MAKVKGKRRGFVLFGFRHYESLRENKMRCFSCGICQTNESKSILKVSLSQVYACSH